MRNPDCKLCPLHAHVKTVCVDGYGARKPRFLFIGEAPGETEDEQGRPFVGDAGKLLAEHIKLAGLFPARVTNAVRCRPPENREPKVEELMACRDYLSDEIMETKPEFLVAVGGIALKVLTGKTGITTWSGRIAGEVKGMTVLGLLHPSYIMRSGNYDIFRQDCVSLKEVAETVTLFKKHFPKASIADAVGFTMPDAAVAMAPVDREAEMMMKLKCRLRPMLMAQVPGLLIKARKEKKNHEGN